MLEGIPSMHGLHGHTDRASELKQQDDLAAARDPHNGISVEQAEHKVLAQARSSGAAAFQFDPNASAQEKAQQAKSVCVGAPECWLGRWI